MTAPTNGDLYLCRLHQEATEAVKRARMFPLDSPDFAYWTSRAKTFREAAGLYNDIRGQIQTGRD